MGWTLRRNNRQRSGSAWKKFKSFTAAAGIRNSVWPSSIFLTQAIMAPQSWKDACAAPDLRMDILREMIVVDGIQVDLTELPE